MRASEFINEISRRGFLKGLGAAAVAGTAGSAMAAPFTHGQFTDKMSGKTQGKYSEVRSYNSKAVLTIQWPGSPFSGVWIEIPDRTMNLGYYSGYGRIKINNKIRDVKFSQSSAGNYQLAKINISPTEVLSSAGELWIEAPIWRTGGEVFKFLIEPDLTTKQFRDPPSPKKSTQPTKPEPESTNPVAQQAPEPVSQVNEPGERFNPIIWRLKIAAYSGEFYYVKEYDPQTFKVTATSRKKTDAKLMDSDTAKKIRHYTLNPNDPFMRIPGTFFDFAARDVKIENVTQDRD